MLTSYCRRQSLLIDLTRLFIFACVTIVSAGREIHDRRQVASTTKILEEPCELMLRASELAQGSVTHFVCSLQGRDKRSNEDLVIVKGLQATNEMYEMAGENAYNLFQDNAIIDFEAGELILPLIRSSEMGPHVELVGRRYDNGVDAYSDNNETSNSLRRRRHMQTTFRPSDKTFSPRTVLVVRIEGDTISTTASAAQLRNDWFEDESCLRGMMARCSYNQELFLPASGNQHINGGIVTVRVSGTIDTDTAKGALAARVPNYLEYDHVAFCMPQGTISANAFANVNHWISYYRDTVCSHVSAQMHEIGHNIGFMHSGTPAAGLFSQYGDMSGSMGIIFKKDDQQRCYNAAKTWQRGWFNRFHRTIDSGTDWRGNIYGIYDVESVPSDGSVVILRVTAPTTNFFIHFNRDIGPNTETSGANKVMISKTATQVVGGLSTLLAELEPGSFYTDEGMQMEVSFENRAPSNGFATVAVTFGANVRPNTAPSPAPTEQPTIEPATAPLGPPNDECMNARSIEAGTFIGTTDEASVDALDFCGTEITAPGVWYTVIGTGARMTVDTCSPTTAYDSKISVFEGACSSLACVDGNDDSCDVASSVSWLSVAGREYSVLVHGYAAQFGVFQFQLSLEATLIPTGSPTHRPTPQPTTHPTAALSTPRPPNDACNAAQFVADGSSFGSTVDSLDDSVDFCGTDITSGGVWYTVLGTGGTMGVDTCSSSTTYDSQISIFQGPCSSLSCVDGNDDGCDEADSVSSAITWESVFGREYKVLVHGFESDVGDFELTVTTAISEDSEDSADSSDDRDGRSCQAAAMSQSTQLGSTIDSTNEIINSPIMEDCNGNDLDGPGVWYTVIGNNFEITATTCNAATNFDTQISVFSGSCSNPVCITGNDDFNSDDCGVTSAVTWFGEDGVEYHLLVHGYDSATGAFRLNISEL